MSYGFWCGRLICDVVSRLSPTIRFFAPYLRRRNPSCESVPGGLEIVEVSQSV